METINNKISNNKTFGEWINEFTFSVRDVIRESAEKKFEEIKNQHGIKNSSLLIRNDKPLGFAWDYKELMLVYSKLNKK